jgi:membrane protein
MTAHGGSAAVRVRAWASAAADAVPGVRRVAEELIRVELLDRALVVAAQSLFAMVPLLVVVAAFTPETVRDGLLAQIGDVMAVEGSAFDGVRSTVSAEQVRTQTGLVGLVVVFISATGFARALQRLYERVWQVPHIGGIVGTRRSIVWLAGCLAYLQVLGLLLAVLSGLPGASVWRLTGQVVASTVLWWWSAHALLQRREPWRHLLPGAVLTAVGLAALTRLSEVMMPPYVTANVAQFGLLGLLFAASTWLLVLGGVLVVAAVVGRVAVVRPRPA